MARILIVEDNQSVLDFCIRCISNTSSSIEVFSATNAEKTIKILDSYKIEGAFIDIELPGMNGFELARIIRDRDDYHLLPIIFATGTDNNSVETYKTYHNYDYIDKPFTEEKLNQATMSLLAEIDSVKKAVSKENKKVIKVDSPAGVCIIDVNTILYIHKKIDRVAIVTENASAYYYLRQSLESFKAYINDIRFLRCNKSTIVNISKIIRIKQCSSKTWDLFLSDDGKIKCELSYLFSKDVLMAVEKNVY